jgi:hypothetical protein
MSLFLNDNKIPGHNQKVSIDLKFASEDMSGNSSSTAKAQKGDKGKTIKVQTSIKFVDADQLSLLVNLAEAKDASGEQAIYHIVNHTANAMNMRQGFFDETLSVKENETTEDWSISFTLSEHHSVPEKKEARKAAKKVTEQAAKGTPVNSATPGAAAPANVTEQAVELTPLEQKIKGFDSWLGGG